ncbi:PP2C family protein-serine/threonine phosphatase [Streptomyces sp. WAC06614]|uniref:PP2C family protein-serine/threonine phosphatase n=1 Tax=Streptomyces sp. WAC06614 TaxID=2487416 RepID=UPI000F779D8D|nr:fused response regulator/phosphatase [Streptomyces sp. WAC06614]RSS81981.1 phosphatase [Streptomyces sp. WAC06614]
MPVPVPRQRDTPAAESGQATLPSATPQVLTLLVIDDDPAGGLTVPEVLDTDGHRIRLRTARNLTEAARLLTPDVHCVLLDLSLPRTATRAAPAGAPAGSATGTGPATAADGSAGDRLDTLRELLRLAPRHAVLVVTSEADAERAAEAVRVGATDFLFRDELDGRLLNRAVRYAVERKRADIAQYKLAESRLRAQENARLERGLLPTPLLEGSDLRFAARYHAGRSRALLGGDFYDTVRTPDGTVHAMIGDVCGHGPDEAALGVELRIAWRALTLAGLCGDELLATLQQVLEVERPCEEIFATLCTVDISPDGRSAGLCLAGHPAPLITRPGRPARLLPYEDSGPALGLLPKARWPRRQVELGGTWSLLMYTDGLIEGRIGEGRERLGQDGMVDMINRHLERGLRGERLLEAAVTEARRLNGGELTDDVAVVLLDRAGTRSRPRATRAGAPGAAAAAQRPPL